MAKETNPEAIAAAIDTAVDATPTKNPPFCFIKGSEDLFAAFGDSEAEWDRAYSQAREHVGDAMNAKHLSFLLGSGCSSFFSDGREVGIPTMAPMAKRLLSSTDASGMIPTADRDSLKNILGLDVGKQDYTSNLERLLEVLFSYRFVLARTDNKTLAETLAVVERVITHVTRFICKACSEGPFSNGDSSVLRLYQAFYRRLIYRDRTLPRPWVFTTNYDLFNETALDRLGIQYCNGFSGTIERRFNPAIYRYALAEQLDVASTRWSTVDGYMYLCKLHGSTNWEQDDVGLFPIRERHGPDHGLSGPVMIYPTPTKQNLSFGAPYSDLFREFQGRVAREQSVLITLGYGFGDEHINNLIFQALTIPTFRLIAFVQPDSSEQTKTLRALNDPRIWIIGARPNTSGRKAHYFDMVVERFMPEAPGNQVDTAVERILAELLSQKTTNKPPSESSNANG